MKVLLFLLPRGTVEKCWRCSGFSEHRDFGNLWSSPSVTLAVRISICLLACMHTAEPVKLLCLFILFALGWTWEEKSFLQRTQRSFREGRPAGASEGKGQASTREDRNRESPGGVINKMNSKWLEACVALVPRRGPTPLQLRVYTADASS